MVTTDEKINAVKITLVAHEQGRLSDQELNKLAKVIERTPTVEEDTEE